MRSHSEQNTDRSLLLRAMWVSGIFLGAHLVAGLWTSHSIWGMDFLGFYSPWYWGVFALCGACLFVPRFRSVCLHGIDRLFGSLPWYRQLGFLVVAFGLFYAFRIETYFLGDGDLLLRDLSLLNKYEAWKYPNRAPLILWTIKFLDDYELVVPLLMYRIYSWLSGLLYLLVCFKAARQIGRRSVETALVFGALITPGFVQLFFGYVENYALLFPLALGYLLTGYRALKAGGSLLLPAVLMGLMMPTHFMTVSLFPSFVILVYYRSFSMQTDAGFSKRLMQSAGVFLLPIVLTFALLVAISFDFVAYLQMPKHHVLAFSAVSRQYGLFSLPHLFDLVNQFFLTAPFAIMVLAMIPVHRLPTHHSEHIFLGVTCLFPVLLAAVFNPEIGFFKDWDALSMTALPLIFWSAILLIGQVRPSGVLAHIGLLFIGASALHTAFWIGVNANEQRGVARYDHVLRTNMIPLTAHAWAWETLGIYHMNREDYTRAREAFLNAIEINPENARFWNAVGLTYLHFGELESALSYFQKALERNPNLAEAEGNLGSVYFSWHQFDKARYHYQRAVRIKPDFVPVHLKLGQIYALQENWVLSIRHYREAAAFDLHNAAAWHGLGVGLFEQGAIKSALRAFRQVILLQPDDADAAFNLAVCYQREGVPDSAAVYLSRAAALDPERFSDPENMDLLPR